MAISIPDTRQYPLVAYASFALADTASGVGVAVFALPQNAVVTGGQVIIDTAYDSGTSDAIEVGDAGDNNRYLTTTSVAAAGRTALVPTGYQVANANRNIEIEVTSAGTAATEGSGRIQVEYIVEGRSTENFE